MNKAVQKLRYESKGTIALLLIDPSQFQGNWRKEIIVMSENYCSPEHIKDHYKPWKSLEEIQDTLGNRLKLEGMCECKPLNRMVYKYSFHYGDGDYVMAFPATGEETYLDLYSLGLGGELILQVHTEL